MAILPADMPANFNQLVPWLLAQIAGIPTDGSVAPDALVPGIATADQVFYFTSDEVSQGVATEIEIQLPARTRHWKVCGIALHVTGGTGTTYAPAFGQVTGFAADDSDERGSWVAQVVADPVNTTYVQGVNIYTDADHKIYLQPRFDAAADNTITVQLWLEPLNEIA